MNREAFEQLVAEEFPNAVPEKFLSVLKNIVFLVDDEPSLEMRHERGLLPHETLLGLYRGIPTTERDTFYGVGGTLPDTITLFQRPIEEVAAAENVDVRRVIRDTLWHEVAHHFGYDELQIRGREEREGR
jgi:predicted Zn-dependent protease with MMP-like domain